MITAIDALDSIEQAVNSLHNNEDQLAATLKSASEDTARLRAEQSAQYRALARIRLDALQQQQISGALDNAEVQAKAGLDALNKRLGEIEQQGKASADTLATSQAERIEKAKALAKAKDAIVTLEISTHKRLADNVDWQAAAANANGARARAVAADNKAVQSEKDRDEKSAPYIADKLFIYLWQRGYGTAAYRGGPLARMGDNFVARTISYEEARQNYFMLTEIPKRLREHADRLKGEAEAERAKLEAFERKAFEEDGIIQLEQVQEAANKALLSVGGKVKDGENARAALDAERADLLNGGDQRGMLNIVSNLADALVHEDIRTMLLRARQTPSQEDDKIVNRLQQIESSLDSLQKQIDAARTTAIDLARKRAELERAHDNFMQAGYDRRGGSFVNELLIGNIISGILQGAMVSATLDDALRSGYREQHRSNGNITWGGGGGWGGGSDSGGSWGGGGFSSGGGGGGGFSTGGGF